MPKSMPVRIKQGLAKPSDGEKMDSYKKPKPKKKPKKNK